MQSVTELGFGITCLDAGYVQPGLACFYLLEQAGEFAIVETGTSHSLATLEQCLSQKGVAREQVRYVIPTHVHLDHAGGAGAMMAALPNATLLIHPRGARHMVEPGRLVASAEGVYGEEAFKRLYGHIEPVPLARVREMQDGEALALAGRELVFRHTRGHANHHMCIWDEASAAWFTGDMFGVSYPWFRFQSGDFVLPSSTPTQFDPAAFLESLELLAAAQPRAMYLTHYGELPYNEQVLNLLRKQVETYPAIARQSIVEDEDLQLALERYSLGLLADFAGDASPAEQKAWLQFDLQLNAQGLAMWLQAELSRD